MTPEIALSSQPALPPDWEVPTPPTDLIFDDGEPLESNRHRIAMNVLIRSAQQALSARPDSFVGGNMFVYYSRQQVMNRDFRGPDFFAVLGAEPDRERQGWVIWEESGRYPDVIVELLSPSTAAIDRGAKKDLYEQTFRTPDYFVFDPFDPTSLAGWRLDLAHGYQPLTPNDRGWLWCETLELWLGTWEGAIDREPVNGSCAWLRFYTPQGDLVLLPEEVAQQQAEQAQQQAEQAQQQAEQAQQQAEQEKQRADRLAAKLRELGVDPSA
ncbi:Uma2 family endonuclease [Oculatella sp. LEGE 06141]|uniref:Uma2 family endonuclease n=1 Tax=Oculatella sp. LEGE 06141 TaxID=1828648 RepID=UPI00187EDD88|nr:Uma2 family endonuclease [Oculatella sp. LEGE 06141]MBE9180610.1 Uma2 family endonuclease [Oculatella sp. LEGE 06141]